MNYNFDEIIDRTGYNSVKWTAAGEGVIPMWVADMDFRAAPCIMQALERRLQHGIFGYVSVPQDYYDATIHWFKTRHHFTIERDWIVYTTGVVPAISAIIKGLLAPGDKVAVLTPVYNCFFSSIRNNGCHDVQLPLRYDVATGRYDIDFAALDAALQDPAVKMLILCNPHNPAARVWTRDELQQIGETCLKHNVIVVSDEIHCEIVMPGFSFTPFASIDERFLHNSITCSSVSKAWNVAGLQIANIVTSNPQWRERIDRAININEVCDVNPFGVEALIAAYRHGGEWIDELCRYIRGNFQLMKDFLRLNFPAWTVTPLEGTYLAWVNIRSTGMTSDEMTQFLRDEARVLVNSGPLYGAAGEGFIRLNLAMPRVRLEEAMRRISAAFLRRR